MAVSRSIRGSLDRGAELAHEPGRAGRLLGAGDIGALLAPTMHGVQLLGRAGVEIGRVSGHTAPEPAVDVEVEDQALQVHGPHVVVLAPAREDVRLEEHQMMGIGILDRPDQPLCRIVGWAAEGDPVEEAQARMGRSRVEALQMAGDQRRSGRCRRGRQVPGERLVDRVVAGDPGIVGEVPRHRLPHPVVLPLQVADDVVGPEVLDGRAQGGIVIGIRPPAGERADGLPVGAHRPRRGTLAAELGAVDVLVHVEQCVDVVTAQQVDSLCHLGQVGRSHRRVELVGVPWRAGRADGGVVGRCRVPARALPRSGPAGRR